MVGIKTIPWISDAHRDVVGIAFGLLVSVAAILVILMAAGVVRVPCTRRCDNEEPRAGAAR